jgi:hypothetical protein
MNIIEIKLVIANKRNEVSQNLIDQGASDFAEFKYKQGLAHGLNFALTEIKKLEQKERNNNEDEDEA